MLVNIEKKGEQNFWVVTLNNIFNSRAKTRSKIFTNVDLKGNFLVNYIINAPYITLAYCYSSTWGYISKLNSCLTKHLADLLPLGDSVSQHFHTFSLK